MIPKALLYVCLMLGGPPAFAATSATTETPATATPITTTTSINPSAQQGKSSQDSGSAMNMAASAMMMAACMATQPPNMALCMMGAMAAMQAGADDDAADQSAATQAATNTSGATTTNKPTFASAAAGSATFADQAVIKKGLTTLKDAGYTATPAGISSASGNIAASSFGSSGAMLAAGLDPGAVKQAEKIGKDVQSKYATMSMAADTSGAGGGGGDNQSANANDSGSSGGDQLKSPFALGNAKRAEMMAGKTVQFDGEPIGVRGDDIFQMVHVAYDRKRAGKHFIETDHDPDLNKVLVRAPASAIKPAGVNTPPTFQTLSFPRK